MTDYKLSIIIPCYKVEKYLTRCIDSLLEQTLEGIELVCINDGSPDGCLSIMKDYRSRYGDRILIIDKENEGVWNARRDGIAAASGEYIGFIDPDDYVRSEYASKLYNTAKSYDADISACGFERIDEEKGRSYSREMTGFRYKCFDIRKEPGLMLEVNAAIWNKIFRASVIKNMGNIPDIPKAFDDLIFAHLIYANARTIAFVNEALICYTVRGDSIISTLKEEYVPGIYKAMKELRQVYAEKSPSMLAYVDSMAFLHLGISLMHRLSANDKVCIDRAIRNNTQYLNKEFPLWSRSPYIRPAFILSHRGVNLKLYIVRRIYGLSLLKLFLSVYGFMIGKLGIDIKW